MAIKNPSIEFLAITGLPLINKGDSIADLLIEAFDHLNLIPVDGDIFVVTQKIVSKSEGRIRNLENITPGFKAKYYSLITGKDARFVQLVLEESKQVIRARKNTLIVEHKKGFICANAGVDHSNVSEEGEKSANAYLLLPEDPDGSARMIGKRLEAHFKKKLGVLIIDSHGRAWRNGTIGMTIGLYNVPGVVDLRGKEDLFGYKLRITIVGSADELAAGASLLMGQAKEGVPCILARGFPYDLRDSSLDELIRPKKNDLFR